MGDDRGCRWDFGGFGFAHGANDVANAIGPLAAIVNAASTGAVNSQVGIPLWVMIVGAVGISAGLVLFGPRLIRTVGEQITKLDQARAFTVALSAAITVIVASALGLPVSSTHIAIGGVFGIGFLREYLDQKKKQEKAEAKKAATAMSVGKTGSVNWGKRRNKLQKIRGRKLVRRRHLLTIVAAWVITVPLSAILSAVLFYIFRFFA